MSTQSNYLLKQGVESPYEQPWPKVDKSQCQFYHSIDLPAEVIHGDWDLRQKYDLYTGKVDFKDARVLDTGCASGAISFYIEQQGGNVVSADVASAKQYTKVPYFDDVSVSNPEQYLIAAQRGLNSMKNSYWYSWHSLLSSNKVFYGDLFSFPGEIGLFEIGFLGQILVHNRDPLGLLEETAMRTTDTLIISEGMNVSDERTIGFMPNPSIGVRPHGYFRFSTKVLIEYVELMGFKCRSVTTESYTCGVRGIEVPITTIVADRMPNTMKNSNIKPVVDMRRFPGRNSG